MDGKFGWHHERRIDEGDMIHVDKSRFDDEALLKYLLSISIVALHCIHKKVSLS